MHHKYQDDKADYLKQDTKHHKFNEKYEPSKQFQIKPSDFYKNNSNSQFLLEEIDSLKFALNSALKKKEDIFKVLVQYKEALEAAQSKIINLENHLNEVELVKQQIEKVRKQLIKRDEKIKSLHNRNKTLENLLENHQESENIYLKSFSMKKSHENPASKLNLSLLLESLLHKVKSNTIFHKIFKTCCACLNSFMDLVQQRKTEEICLKLCKFSSELMKEIEKNSFRVLSPAISEVQPSLSSYNSVIQNPSFINSTDDEYYQKNDEERIEKLNYELKSIMAKSKEVLSNRSFSVSLKQNSKLESSFSPLNTQSVQSDLKSINKMIDITKDSLQEVIEVQPKSSKSIARRIPKVEIIGKPGNRSAKILPKSSILKKK